MSTKNKRIQKLLSILFKRYVNDQSTDQERDLVDKIYESLGEKLTPDQQELNRVNVEIKDTIHKRLFDSPKKVTFSPARYAIAASLLICLGLSIYFFGFRNNKVVEPSQIVSLDTKTETTPTLSVNEKQLYVINKEIPKGSVFKTVDKEKVLDLTDLPKESKVNRISIENPSKTPISLLLMDGSQVWLNFKSKLDFDFDEESNMRLAYVEGEVFMHVKKFQNNDQAVPFTVKTTLQTIEVLGTQFNINASSPTEEHVELLEGSIRLTHNKSAKKVLLTPGQKAFLNDHQAQILVLKSKSDEKAKAWRRGLFYFENESMSMVGKELTSWYDKPVILEESLQGLPISGMIKRYDDIQKVLELIELTNNIKFKHMNNKIYISRKN